MAHAKYDLWPDDWPIVSTVIFSLCYSWPEGTVPTSNNLSSFRSFSQQSPKSKLQVLQVLLIDVLHKFFVVLIPLISWFGSKMILPSGKHTKNYGNMAIFNSYVKLPEGNVWVGISRNNWMIGSAWGFSEKNEG